MNRHSLMSSLSVAVFTLACAGSDPEADGDPTGGGGSPDAGSEADTRPRPPEAFLPSATGPCPGFVEGDGCRRDDTSLICDFTPDGIVTRPVRIYIGERAWELDGPLVVFWHGLGGQAANASTAFAGLGPDVVAQILDEGGIVASPERSEKRESPGITELPWLLALPTSEDQDDLLVMDDVLACAREVVGIDIRRIHATGMSAGGLQTGQVGPRRSGYIASTVTLSGGQLGDPPVQDPENRYPVALFHGGPDDIVVLQFMEQAELYKERLDTAGHFNIICDHQARHTVPPAAAQGAWQFMKDHPYGAGSEPYADGFPAGIPEYCQR
jgi:predicted esterase